MSNQKEQRRKQLDHDHEHATVMAKACEITIRDLELRIEEDEPGREEQFELELRIVRATAGRDRLKAKARRLEAEHDAITCRDASKRAAAAIARETAQREETRHAALASCAEAILDQLEETHRNTSAPGRIEEELEDDYRPGVTSPDEFPTGAEQADRPSPEELDREAAIAEELELGDGEGPVYHGGYAGFSKSTPAHIREQDERS